MSKGLKRICMNCGVRFYDLDKTPIICPSCETEFTGEIKVKARKGRVAAIKEDLAAKTLKVEAEAETEEESAVDDNDDSVLLNEEDDDSDINAVNDDKDVDDLAIDDDNDNDKN